MILVPTVISRTLRTLSEGVINEFTVITVLPRRGPNLRVYTRSLVTPRKLSRVVGLLDRDRV